MLNTFYKGFSILFIVRILSRVIDFFLKIFVIRAIDPTIFAATVHFQLIINMSLFYSKTCLKNTYQKRVQNLDQNSLVISSTNLMLAGVPISASIALFMIIGESYFNKQVVNLFFFSAILHGIAAVLQSFQQSLISKLVLDFKYESIGQIEIISLLLKSSVLWISVYLSLFQIYGVLIFGFSQLVYSIALVMVTLYKQSFKTSLLKKIEIQGQEKYYIHPEMTKAAKEFSLMSFVKLMLQQLQKIVLVGFNISTLSSDYTIISNLGSVIPRYIFMPLQQIGLNIFSKSNNKIENRQTLSILMRLLILFGLFIITFGFSYSDILLKLLFGTQWATTQIVNALKIYCIYVLIMGINGISEAFVYARIVPQQLKALRMYMVFTTIIYLMVTISFVKIGLGAAGLFLSSCISMIFRIFICWNLYIKPQIFQQSRNFIELIYNFLPCNKVLLSQMISGFICWNIRNIFNNNLLNLIIGGVVAMLNLFIVMRQEKQIMKSFNQIKNKKDI